MASMKKAQSAGIGPTMVQYEVLDRDGEIATDKT